MATIGQTVEFFHRGSARMLATITNVIGEGRMPAHQTAMLPVVDLDVDGDVDTHVMVWPAGVEPDKDTLRGGRWAREL